MNLTLRAKGVVAFVGLVLYVGGTLLILSSQRHRLMELAVEIEQVHELENDLTRTVHAVAHAMLRLHEKLFESAIGAVAVEEVSLDMELIEASLRVLTGAYPRMSEQTAILEQDLSELRAAPSRSGFLKLRDSALGLHRYLDRATRQVEDRKRTLWDDYRHINDTMTVVSAAMLSIGAACFGAVVVYFFRRLVWDIKKVQERALAVIRGYHGAPLPVTRQDELGALMETVNQMQNELRRHERRLEISREQRFHQEKMAAIGSLAAAVAHEINNPIAAIAGLAESMAESHHAAAGEGDVSRDRAAEMILEQTRRIGIISRQIAELTAPHSPEPALLDVNGLIRSTCNFVHYDKRFRDVELVFDLDADLPAIEAVADHLTQVMMNLLINAADAVEGCRDRTPAIKVTTRSAPGEAIIEVNDNGHGMDHAIQARAFEEAFTTKPAGKGRGLGLYLCRTLVEEAGGGIVLRSEPGVGTTVSVRFPATVPAAS